MKIACVGNAVFDCVVSGNGFIVEGIRNSYDNATFSVGGPALNAASVINRFGNEVDLYARVGNDIFGSFILNVLNNEKISTKYIKISNDIITPFSNVIINRINNTRTICPVRSKKDFIDPKIGFDKYGNDYDYILTDGKYFHDSLGLIKNNPQALSVIDAGRVNISTIKLCRIVNYIICSEDFVSTLTGLPLESDEDRVKAYTELKSLFPDSIGIAITIGKNGYIYEKDGLVYNNGAYQPDKPVIDTNGAGDIFHGAFTYALSSGYDFYDSLEFSNITASLSTTKIGGKDSCPSLEEVVSVFEKNKEKQNKKIITYKL